MIDGKKGYFHCWEQRSEIIDPSPMLGGHGGGVVAYTLAVVELEDGSITKALPHHIKFINKKNMDEVEMIVKALSEHHRSE